MNPADRFLELSERHERRLLAHALWRTRHQQDAEDAVQEGLIWVWRHIERYAELSPGHLLNFMLLCIRRCAIDGYRRRTSGAADPLHLAEGGPEMLQSVADQGQTAPDFQQSVEEVERIAAAVERLPTTPPYRQVIEMRIEGLSNAEIQLKLGCSNAQLTNWLHRARALLKEWLKTDPIP
jgi:RNA polymerase sigma factor (sigma-70 family)